MSEAAEEEEEKRGTDRFWVRDNEPDDLQFYPYTSIYEGLL